MTLHQEEKFSTTLDQAMSGQRPDSLNTNGHPVIVSDISVDANSISGNGITSKLSEVGDCSARKPDVTKIGSNNERTGCRKLSDCPCGRHRRHYSVFSLYTTSSFLLSFVDNLVFNGLVIGPLTVSFWRGVWVMLDEQLFPSNGAASGWTCVAVGNMGLLIVFYVSGKLKQRLQWPRHRGRVRRLTDWHWLLGYHLFSYVVGVLNVCHWRGLWILLDHYTGINSPSAWISFAVGQVGLWLLRSSKNALASPMSINMDTGKDFFDYTTRFSVNRRKREHFFLDAFLTVFVVHQFVALYWRGLWEALDVHLAPDNDSLSAGVSILAAFVLHVTVCFLEPVLNGLFRLNRVRLIPNRTKSDTTSSLSAGVKSSQGLLPDSSAAAADTAAADSTATNSTKLHRWLLETFFYFIANAVSVLHWRGFWLLLDVYFLPEQKTLSAFISHLVGIVCLWLLLAGNSVALIGCDVDGNSPSQDGCTIPNQYIRYFIRCRQTRIRKAKLVQSQRLDVCGTYPHQLRREKTNGAAIKAEVGDVDVLRAMLTAAFSRSSATEVDCPVVVCSEVELVKDKETANGKYSSAINNNIDIETDHNHEDTARKKQLSTNDDDYDVKRAEDDAVISDCRQLLENGVYADYAGLVETFI